MPRLTKLDDVLFPVEEHSVFVGVRTKSGERRLSVPDKKAIVNTKTNRVLGVVSRGYRLVTNRQALDWAYQCCQTVFPETKSAEWEVKASDAPGTGGHCFIDLAHNSTVLDFKFVPAKDRPDAFGPFIRVSNSYNGLRALAFDIGFFRKVCKNGLIVPRSIIRFKFTHSQKDIGETISFEVSQKRLSEIKTSFNEYFKALRDCKISRSEFEPLFCGVLKIRKPKNMTPQSPIAAHWEALSQGIGVLCGRYAEELGENAYAVFNAITEFASYPPQNRCVYRERHSFQRLAGDWLSKFSQECRNPDFALSSYLEALTKHDGNGDKILSEGVR
jgi:Domain of unknown function (DUF932)